MCIIGANERFQPRKRNDRVRGRARVVVVVAETVFIII